MEITTTTPDPIQSIEVLLGLKGETGLSAYEVWKRLPGNETGTEEEFFEALRGVGITGATVDENGHMVIQYDDGRQTETELQPIVQAIAYRDQAKESATESANSAEDASQSAEQAKASEEASKVQATASANSAQESSNYAEQANTAMNVASKSAEQSGQFASNAASSATAAKQSADNAKDSETKAHQSESNAGNSASQASQSAAEAGNSADAAASAEENASRSMDMAQKWAEATDSPDGTSDSDSSTGKTQSSRSWALYSKDRALAAENSATNAAMSEVDASASAIQANQSENNAKQSETNAASSASNAAQSATSAKQNADIITGNINTAVTKADEAANSATDASASASQANTSATNAANSASNALNSENRAKEYADKVQEVVDGLSSAYVYMGSVDNYADLPKEGLKKGYMYNIINADPVNQVKAGDNVVWNGEAWDNLSGYVDLSGLAKKTDLPTKTSDLANDSGYITAADDITGNAATATNVAWSGVTGKPSTFSPSQHTHTSSEVTGLSTVAISGSYNDLMNAPEISLDKIAYGLIAGVDVPASPNETSIETMQGEIRVSVSGAQESLEYAPAPGVSECIIWSGGTQKDGKGNVIDETYATKSELEGVTIDDSNFAKLNQTNTFTGNNTFQGTFTVTTSKTSASGSPTSDNHISNKKYVDDTVNNAVTDITNGTTIVGKAKDSMSCEWSNVKNKPTLAAVATSGSYKDLKDTPSPIDTSGFATLAGTQTLTGNKTFTGTTIFNGVVTVGTPVYDTSATTKKYVDDAIETAISNIVNGDEVAY